MDFFANKIRNVAVFGHQGSGKTTLVESLNSVVTGAQKGSVEKKNTISDFLNEEKNRLMSCSMSVVPLEYKDFKINVLDLPGNDDFIYEAIQSTAVAEGAILLLDGTKKVEVEALKHFKILRAKNTPIIVFANKLDKEGGSFDDCLNDATLRFGKVLVPLALPIGKDVNFKGYVDVLNKKAFVDGNETSIPQEMVGQVDELNSQILEKIAETDDALIEKFFAGEPFTKEETEQGLKKAIKDGKIVPLIVGSANTNVGLTNLLDLVISLIPSPEEVQLIKQDKKVDVNETLTAYIFKTTVDPYSGTVSYVKVLSGQLKSGEELLCPNVNKPVRISTVNFSKGKETTKVECVNAGDICTIPKLEDCESLYTLCDKNNPVTVEATKYPSPVYFRALTVENKKDEDKIAQILNKVLKESPSVELKRNVETKQLLIGGLSDTHLKFIQEKIKNTYNIPVLLDSPKVVYREAIKGTATAPGRYIKQSGGSGHYGVVEMRFEPSEENVFAEEIFGGAVPKSYFPAVEKGFFEALQSGLLAGFPVVGVKGTLTDGKDHPVDSDELAFKMAAVLAFKEAYMKCNPTILEPVMKLTIHVENQYIGNILSDLNLRRARVMSTEEHGEETEVIAMAPESEILDYATKLRVLTQGGGDFTREFDSFQEVPSQLQDKVLKENSLLNKEQ